MIRPVHSCWPLVAVLCVLQPLSAQSNNWVDTIKATSPAVVTILTDNALGSGFIISAKGVIATNNHVIAGARDVEVKLSNGEVYKGADIIFTDPDRDIALIKIAAVDLPMMALGNSDKVSLGEDVLLIGAPIGLEETVSTGVVSGLRLHNGTKVIQTTAPASHGSSGGPLLNRSGDAIGLMTFLVEGGQNLNFAVSINYVRASLESLPRSPISHLGPLSEQPAPVAAAKSGGILVFCYRTPKHVQYSSASVFDTVADEIMLSLKSEGVPMVNDRVGRVLASAAPASMYELISAGEKARAQGVLYITVDRPVVAWLKVTARFYDLTGHLLWQEEAEKKSGLTSGGSIEKVCHSLESKMHSHLIPFIGSQPQTHGARPAIVVTDTPR
jgi:S1-C subfamily serine protease